MTLTCFLYVYVLVLFSMFVTFLKWWVLAFHMACIQPINTLTSLVVPIVVLLPTLKQELITVSSPSKLKSFPVPAVRTRQKVATSVNSYRNYENVPQERMPLKDTNMYHLGTMYTLCANMHPVGVNEVQSVPTQGQLLYLLSLRCCVPQTKLEYFILTLILILFYYLNIKFNC